MIEYCYAVIGHAHSVEPLDFAAPAQLWYSMIENFNQRNSDILAAALIGMIASGNYERGDWRADANACIDIWKKNKPETVSHIRA